MVPGVLPGAINGRNPLACGEFASRYRRLAWPASKSMLFSNHANARAAQPLQTDIQKMRLP